MHSGNVFTYRRDDRRYLGPGSQPTSGVDWLPLS